MIHIYINWNGLQFEHEYLIILGIYWLTWKVLYHFSNKITKMNLHFTYTGVILVCFHFKIKPSTIHILNKCWMQWHCVTLNDARTKLIIKCRLVSGTRLKKKERGKHSKFIDFLPDSKRSIFGNFLQNLNQLQS